MGYLVIISTSGLIVPSSKVVEDILTSAIFINIKI